jgi:hypothetical protein
MERVWAEGGGLADIPPIADIPLPQPPAHHFSLHSAPNKQLLCFGGKPMVGSLPPPQSKLPPHCSLAALLGA